VSFETITMDILTGKVALVTGASLGIGRAIAEAFAKAGVDVAVNYFQHQAEADEACGCIRRSGRRALAVQADVSKSAEVSRLVKTVAEGLETHPESPAVTALSSFGGPSDRIEE
jgi:3-oxoacyl-[acyl-carrier protein] reductase